METFLTIHEGGCAELLARSDWQQRVATEIETLDRRWQRVCQPKGIVGRLLFRLRKRRAITRIKARLDPSNCLYGTRGTVGLER